MLHTRTIQNFFAQKKNTLFSQTNSRSCEVYCCLATPRLCVVLTMTATSANGIVPFDEKDFLPPPPETNWYVSASETAACVEPTQALWFASSLHARYHLDTDLIATICFDARGAAARSNAESDCSAVTSELDWTTSWGWLNCRLFPICFCSGFFFLVFFFLRFASRQ